MNKHLAILIGPPGCGKTTYCKEYLPEYCRISQDEQGKVEHFKLFEKALKDGVPNIVIDRMNFNKEQRKKYIEPARSLGYKIECKRFHLPYEECLNRIIKREGHATIPANDLVTARKALDTYWENFEEIDNNEDNFFVQGDSPHWHDFSYQFAVEGRRFIIVGDIHGCYDEFWDLMKKCKWMANDIVISVGDLVDRGPSINHVISDFHCYPNFYYVRGNHDDKVIRWLRGNKVNMSSIAKSVEQIDYKHKNDIYCKMMNAPYIITFGNNAVTHAGFHPNNDHPSNNSPEFSKYARKYDPAIRTFTNDNSCSYWYTYPRKNEKHNLFFGHEIHEDKCEVMPNIYAMDAGCVFGGALRGAIVQQGAEIQIVEVPSRQPKIERDNEWDFINKFEPYEKLVEQGYLNKQESGNLVLYNYAEKCTFDKMWNKYTMECRGLILNKVTGETVARPFKKFFNLGEHQSTTLTNLPIEPYNVYEKVDGSLGILYLDPADNMWKIATRGSFTSPQAKKATEMFHKKNEHDWSSHNHWAYHTTNWHNLTLLFEIIYPENRIQPGARLVVDYGSKETLVLLAAIDKVTGKEVPGHFLFDIAEQLNLPLVKEYEHTIDEMIELKKTLPRTEEGFVIKYENGLRIKIKGDEYCKMQRILNSITPLFIWELMKENKEFVLDDKYLMSIPEEILPEVNDIQSKLKNNATRILTEISDDYTKFRSALFLIKQASLTEINEKKELGLFCQDECNKVRHKPAMFLRYDKQWDKIGNYVTKVIRPGSNIL